MRHSNQYDGTKTVIHRIQPGETLSSVARKYKFSSWEPIWKFNTAVRQVLTSGDPDRIGSGVEIFIPRSKDGYNHTIKQLKVLQVRIQNSLTSELYQLESDHDRHMANRVMFDFAADVATSLASIGLQARKASQVAEAAEKVVGRDAIAAEYLAHKEGEKLFEKLKDKLIEVTLDATVEKGTEHLSEHRKEKVKHATEYGKATYQTVKAVRNFSVQGGRFFLDMSEVLLQFCKPTKIADVWLLLVAGETPEDTFKYAKGKISKAITDSDQQISDRIDRLESERDLLYPGATAPVERASAATP